jgi:hypothetical protein
MNPLGRAAANRRRDGRFSLARALTPPERHPQAVREYGRRPEGRGPRARDAFFTASVRDACSNRSSAEMEERSDLALRIGAWALEAK